MLKLGTYVIFSDLLSYLGSELWRRRNLSIFQVGEWYRALYHIEHVVHFFDGEMAVARKDSTRYYLESALLQRQAPSEAIQQYRSLDHPLLLPFEEVYTEDSFLVFIRPYEPIHPLREVISEREVDEDQVVAWSKELLNLERELRSKPLKMYILLDPRNIGLTEDGELKVLFCGIENITAQPRTLDWGTFFYCLLSGQFRNKPLERLPAGFPVSKPMARLIQKSLQNPSPEAVLAQIEAYEKRKQGKGLFSLLFRDSKEPARENNPPVQDQPSGQESAKEFEVSREKTDTSDPVPANSGDTLAESDGREAVQSDLQPPQEAAADSNEWLKKMEEETLERLRREYERRQEEMLSKQRQELERRQAELLEKQRQEFEERERELLKQQKEEFKKMIEKEAYEKWELEQQEKERLEQERLNKRREEEERRRQEELEKERLEWERRERERIEKEQEERLKKELERMEKERQEWEKKRQELEKKEEELEERLRREFEQMAKKLLEKQAEEFERRQQEMLQKQREMLENQTKERLKKQRQDLEQSSKYYLIERASTKKRLSLLDLGKERQNELVQAEKTENTDPFEKEKEKEIERERLRKERLKRENEEHERLAKQFEEYMEQIYVQD
jgi:hypothetical protein